MSEENGPDRPSDNEKSPQANDDAEESDSRERRAGQSYELSDNELQRMAVWTSDDDEDGLDARYRTEPGPDDESAGDEESSAGGGSDAGDAGLVSPDDLESRTGPTLSGAGTAPEVSPKADWSLLPVDRDEVQSLLVDLADIADERGFQTLYDEIYEERIQALRQEQMSVVVLGEFNHGKSTVVNALLGEEILPVGITPTTSVITHLVWGKKPQVTVHPSAEADGEEPVEITYQEMDEVIRESETWPGGEPEYVEIAYPNDLLAESLVLVDTPGVNDISRQKVEITYGYVPRADVVLYVLDATQVLKKSEITFIEDRLLEANRERIIFVLGKVDALSDEEAKEVESYARQKLESMLDREVKLFAFSGRDAIEAQTSGAEPPEAFGDFKNELIRFLRDEKAEIIMDSALGGGLRVAGLLEQNLAIERQAYQLEREELEERIRAVRKKLKESRRLIASNLDLIEERIGGIAATARHNLHAFREDFKEQLPRQIEAAEAKDVQLYLSAWIQDQFKQWLEDEGAAIAESLEDLAEEVIEITNESIQETVETFRDEFGLADQLDLEVDTVAYDVSVFALGTVGVSVFFLANTIVGGLLTAATPVLAMFFKGKVDDKIKDRAREEGKRAIDEATEAIEEELLATIHQYGDRLETFVENAGDRLYRQIQEALAQVQRRREEADGDEAVAEVADRLQRVREVAERLEQHRETLSAREDE